MTVRNPALYLTAQTHPAEDFRRLLQTIFKDQEGVIESTGMFVQQAASPNMSVDVLGGRALILGDSATYQGAYFVENRGTTNLTVTASDPTNGRIDLVIAEVLDAEYSGASNLWQLRVVAGTPSGSPTAPSLPVNSIALATVSVPAASSSVINSRITDSRVVINQLLTVTAWTAVTFQNSWTNYDTTSFNAAAYRKIGDVVYLRGLVKSGTVGSAMFTLPSGFRPLKTNVFSVDESTNTHWRVDVNNTGTVILQTGGNNTYVSLDGIQFSTI